MIKSFSHKGLSELWSTGKSRKIDKRMQKRRLVRLDALEAATKPDDMNLPGYDFHALQSFNPTRYTVHINGPWCITFEFDKGDAVRVDLEQYH